VKTLRFPYKPFFIGHPLWPLAGRRDRPRPTLVASVIGPTGTAVEEGFLDTGADDTVFPEHVATKIGLDLTNAPIGTVSGVGAAFGVLSYAEVTLRITDGREFCEWPARVGFTPASLKRSLLGFAGFLQFFRACFDGEREEVELTTNGRYPGT
jgi:hypothetical protein